MITEIADVFTNTAIIVVTDSWFGNNGLWKPLNVSENIAEELGAKPSAAFASIKHQLRKPVTEAFRTKTRKTPISRSLWISGIPSPPGKT